MQQIHEKGYAEPYAVDKRKVYKLGIYFSSETGTITDVEIEENKPLEQGLVLKMLSTIVFDSKVF